ncbi:hypothetical protein WA026_006529 [Henosepilachna vigintioctopunctata]|uniref:Uncharacterized protein n=1 Tax=Henosepilachna vigintioctopunctata TaxID=420089 RepID=A0AAW1U9V9_9CUCU
MPRIHSCLRNISLKSEPTVGDKPQNLVWFDSEKLSASYWLTSSAAFAYHMPSRWATTIACLPDEEFEPATYRLTILFTVPTISNSTGHCVRISWAGWVSDDVGGSVVVQ